MKPASKRDRINRNHHPVTEPLHRGDKNGTIRFFFTLVLTWLGGFAQAQPYNAVPVSLAEGLSQSSVYDIVQDPKGFTWIATQDGLNRYDGTSFRIYREEPFDTNSISSNNLPSLLCDSKGRLWVGTVNHGLNLFLPETEGFRHFKSDGQPGSLQSNFITNIYQDLQGNIFIGTGNGLFQLHEKGADFVFEKIPLLIEAGDTIPDKFVSNMVSDVQGNLWVGTYNGLFRFQTTGNQVAHADWYGVKNGKLNNQAVLALTVDRMGNVWVGEKNGLEILPVDGGPAITCIGKCMNEPDAVSELFTASSGDVWIGYASHGIQVALASRNSDWNADRMPVFDTLQATSRIPLLQAGNTLSFWEDKITRGLIWAGFNAGGMVRLIPVTKHFHTNHLYDSPISTPFVTSLLEYSDGTVFIGTPAGLLRYDPVHHKYTTLQPMEYLKDQDAENYITGMALAPDGSLIVGSPMQMFRVEPGPDRMRVTTIPLPGGRERNFMRNLTTDSKGRIMVLLRYTLYEFDPLRNSFTQLVDVTDTRRANDRGFYLSCLFNDKSGNRWVGTSSGLDFYPAGSGVSSGHGHTYLHDLKDTLSLRSQHILCMTQDLSGNLWIGTMNGLSKRIERDGKIGFLNYSTRDGLKNNVIYSILTDRRTGHLWLSTNNGLTEFDPAGKALATYDLHDGLQSNEFNSYAAYQARDGRLFFGGINGYTSFYPEQILRDTTAPVVNITGIRLNGNKFMNLAEYQQAKSIDLKYKNNSFSISFIGLHYVDPQKNQYAYQLEGFQDDWTYAGNTKAVNFSQLPPGKYTFRVKASNSDGRFSSVSDILTINISPPFYKTIWFYLLIAAFIAGVLYGVHKYRLSLKLAQVREVEQIRRATAADFHDELGHKLTIISWFAEILKKKIGPEQLDLRPHLDRIIEASGTLYHTMKDMLWAMDPDKDSVFDLYQQIREFGLELFDNTGVLFEADSVSEEWKERIISPAHKRHVLLIFKEVMHNSLKHAHGTMTHLDLSRENGHLKFRFRDNGGGFRMNGHNVGHGLNNVKRRAGLIHANIRIKSEGNGTVAELDLPIENLN